MTKFGYRNCKPDLTIDSDTRQFSFNLKDEYLKIELPKLRSVPLAPIERVEICLIDNRLLKNIFLVNSELYYYYEKDWYYSGHSELIPKPPTNILSRFAFQNNDIVLIRADNKPKPANIILFYTLRILLFPLSGWLIFPPNILDTSSSIRKNIFIKIKTWVKLPDSSENDLFR